MQTRPMNSKANIKQYTDSDIPVQSRQPVIAKYGPVESTANQTVINLTFSVDTVNNPAVFFATVDGKELSIGSAYDYTFTSIDSLGFSSQITLTSPIPAGLNIQAWKLGLKKESEFGVDSRFIDLYSSIDEGFQGFVTTSNAMTATATTGSPANGTFHSTVTNRAAMSDLRTNLRAQMGIERIQIQQIAQLQNEFGPNGELVWSTPNDLNGQIRFVGGWSTQGGSYGTYSFTSTQNDYAEITFYGTGINLLGAAFAGGKDWRVTIDGGTESANLIPSTSTIIESRNYAANLILNAISGLTLGVHTIKIRNAAAANNLALSGIEILNEASSIKVNPGSSYLAGKKLTTLAQQTLAYNSSFETGTLGTRGGRVLIYQKSDGSIAKAVQPTNASSATLASADHTNEEVGRTYFWREFGAGRSDDFSSSGAGVNVSFTLDDGSTTLVGSNVNTTNNVFGPTYGANGSFTTFTFTGTGLDVVRIDTATNPSNTDTFSVSVDGASVGTISGASSGIKRIFKIVSGLPYGTHTVKVTRTSTPSTYDFTAIQYIVYQPKKPSLPSGAIELADYNVVADQIPVATAALDTISTGVLRKIAIRELTYVDGTGGTVNWAVGGLVPVSQIGGFQPITDRQNAYYEYTFFGTGFDLRFQAAGNRSANMPVLIDGLAATTANFPSLTSTTLTGTTFSAGLLSPNGTTTTGSGVMIRGLTLGLHKIRVTNPSTGLIPIEAIDIVTPIHSTKSNIYSDLQNTLPVGSQGISDNRKTSAIKDLAAQPKAWAQAFGISSSPTSSVTSYVPVPDMSVTVKTVSNTLKISYSISVLNNTVNGNALMQVYVNGVAVGSAKQVNFPAAGQPMIISDQIRVPVSPGFNKVDLYWFIGTGTATATGTQRNILVEEA